MLGVGRGCCMFPSRATAREGVLYSGAMITRSVFCATVVRELRFQQSTCSHKGNFVCS